MKQSTVVCACIHKKFDGATKILVTKRSMNLEFLPGVYELPGGHAESGESDRVALERELREELNLEVRVGELCGTFDYQTDNEKVTENIYLAEPTSPIENIKMKVDEIDSFRWISEDEVNSVIELNKPADDQEIPILRRAFAILK